MVFEVEKAFSSGRDALNFAWHELAGKLTKDETGSRQFRMSFVYRPVETS